MLRTQISEKDSSIESLLSLKRMSCDVLRDSKEKELRSVCPDLQSSCERICTNCRDLERLLPPADDKDMEAIQCVCDKLRDEIAATRLQLERVQSAYDQSSCETTEESDFSKKLEQLHGQYDSLENQWISQQGDWGLVYEIREDYEKIQTKYQLLQNYVEANASGKQSPKLQAENAEILNEIATFKQRWENTKLQIDQSSSYESLTKAENGELKEQLAKTQTENHSLSTQVKENDRLQKLLDKNSTCDLKLEEAKLAKNQHSRCKFFELADKILQIELHTDSEFCYHFTSTKLKGSQSTDLLRLKLYLDSAKFIEDQSCVQDSTAATVLNGLIHQHKYNLVALTNKEIEEETKEERRLSNKVSKLLNKLISKDELLAETSKKLNNLRKEFRTVSNNAMASRQKIESQISQILEKDKYIEKLKTEIEELSSSASNLEKLNNVLIDRVTNVGKSLAESQRSFNVLQSKEDQSRKLLGEVQEELQKTKVELSTKTEEVEALTAGYKTELETERDALRNKICELEEENRNMVSSHQNELEEFKKDLCEKLEQAQADYLDAVEVQNKLKEAEAERADLLVRMNEMNSSLEDMVSQRDSERVRVLELEKSKAELELSLKHLTVEKHELDISNKKSLDLVKDLQLQLGKLGDAKDRLQTKYEKQEQQEIIALQSRIKEEKAAHSITCENYSKLIAEHEDLVAKKDSEKIALQEHADTLAAKVVDLEKELLKANELLSTQEELKSSLSDAKNLCTERKVQIEHLKNRLNLADGEVLKQNSEKEKLRKDLDLALEEKESAVAKKEDIEMQLADLKKRMSSQASKQEKQILNLNGSIRELQLKIKFLNERKEKLEADIEKNSQYSQNLEVQLREKQKALAASCESYSKLHNDLKAMIIEHAKTNYGLKVDIDLAKQNLLKMTEERDALQAKLETKANCEIKMKEQILKLQKKLSTNKDRDKTHRQAIAQATKEIEQLRNEKKKFQQENIQKNLLISSLENKLTILNTTNESLQPLRKINESKFLTERNQTISVLLNNNPNMGEKMCTLTDKVEKLKRVLPVAPGNGSERNSETETEIVRRNRRIMDYDNNRRQSGWSNLPDSETMTDTADMNGNGDGKVSQEDHPFNSVALCLPRLPHSENGNQGTGNGK